MKFHAAYQSWGRYFHYQHDIESPAWRQDTQFLEQTEPLLPYGLGRSYGDSCLNNNGTLISTEHLNRFIAFDGERGVLRCEAGVTLADILSVIVPRGWFIPVTPGTKYVTIAGAIANDVHGKNHNHVGTFGCHITQLELLRSSGERLICSCDENPELFAATIGGLGLTGFISWAEIQLIPIENAFIQEESIQFANLDECINLFEQSAADNQYTVAWIDCLASGTQLGRGIFTRGNHCTSHSAEKNHTLRKLRSVPFTFPPGCLNKLSVSVFNNLYFRKLGGRSKSSRIDYDHFFYPLDALLNWNRLYGPKGFIQYQCVLIDNAVDAMKELLTLIAKSGQPSPLNVLKEFGDIQSPGLLSFPRKGLTLALDFPNRGEATLKLCNELDVIVKNAGGALYPAKDSRMTAEMFALGYPQLDTFIPHIDPKFSSSFWRRVQPPAV